jgi:redox-sensitive bicupin YhaK (pirin superfamily)
MTNPETGPGDSGQGFPQEKDVSMKKLLRIHQSSGVHWVGNGFPVRSVFSYTDGLELSPFLMLDYAAPKMFAPGNERRGVGGHPHRGFETVTVVYQGELEHRDSTGAGGKIGPGDVQWMTAASGIVHEEFHSAEFTRQGGTLEMVQLWVNLPAKNKKAKPGYQTLLNKDIPTVPLAKGAGRVRVIAGSFGGQNGPARTFTPINLWDVSLEAGGEAELPLPNGHTTALLVLKGQLRVNAESEAVEGDLVILSRSGENVLVKTEKDSKLLVMTGEAINEPVYGRGPFVMNSPAEIQQAFEDYQLGKMGELAEVS